MRAFYTIELQLEDCASIIETANPFDMISTGIFKVFCKVRADLGKA